MIDEIPQKGRRITPADDYSVLQKWLDLESQYLDMGLSKHSAHRKIADEYSTHSCTVFRWTKYLSSAKQHKSRPYEAQSLAPNFSRKTSFLQRFLYDPQPILASLFNDESEQLSLDEISLRLAEKYDYLPRQKTVDRLTQHGRMPTEPPLLTHVPGTEKPGLYQLIQGLYERYSNRF